MSSRVKHKYRHVIFDFDGVLCDSLEIAIEAYESLRKSEFSTLPVVNGRDEFAEVYRGSLGSCLHRWLTEEESRRFFDGHSERMAASIARLRPFAGACQMLADLGRNGYSIVTSAYSDAVRRILSSDSSITQLSAFDIAGRELRKPKTEKIRNILSQLRITQDQAVYVGDLQSDILYCKKVPIDIISVTYGYQPRSYLQEYSPEYIVDSITDLTELLATTVQPSEEIEIK